VFKATCKTASLKLMLRWKGSTTIQLLLYFHLSVLFVFLFLLPNTTHIWGLIPKKNCIVSFKKNSIGKRNTPTTDFALSENIHTTH
ncbi:MAG: hypothetical protein ACXWWC_16415, partial [Chitinophagaceae bacterium]